MTKQTSYGLNLDHYTLINFFIWEERNILNVFQVLFCRLESYCDSWCKKREECILLSTDSYLMIKYETYLTKSEWAWFTWIIHRVARFSLQFKLCYYSFPHFYAIACTFLLPTKIHLSLGKLNWEIFFVFTGNDNSYVLCPTELFPVLAKHDV